MTNHWYAIRSKPHKETFLAEQIGLRKIEFFFPQIQKRSNRSEIVKSTPFFPRYIFINMDLEKNESINELNFIPGSVGLVAFGKEPASIPENIICAIRKRVVEMRLFKESPVLEIKTGDNIEICSGPLQGYSAIFDTQISGSERVRVLLRLLNNRTMRVELPVEHVRSNNRL